MTKPSEIKAVLGRSFLTKALGIGAAILAVVALTVYLARSPSVDLTKLKTIGQSIEQNHETAQDEQSARKQETLQEIQLRQAEDQQEQADEKVETYLFKHNHPYNFKGHPQPHDQQKRQPIFLDPEEREAP